MAIILAAAISLPLAIVLSRLFLAGFIKALHGRYPVNPNPFGE